MVHTAHKVLIFVTLQSLYTVTFALCTHCNPCTQYTVTFAHLQSTPQDLKWKSDGSLLAKMEANNKEKLATLEVGAV